MPSSNLAPRLATGRNGDSLATFSAFPKIPSTPLSNNRTFRIGDIEIGSTTLR
jgi:hypothetical protein